MADVIHIVLPAWQFAALLLAPLAVLAAAAAGLRRLVRRRSMQNGDKDWSVPPLADAAGATIFHRWDIRCKLATLIVYSFLVASIGHVIPAIAAVAVSVLALVLARSSPARALMRLLAITGFLAMFLVVMPLSAPAHPGDTVLVIDGVDWMGFNLRGLYKALAITAKAAAIALLMEPLLTTAPLPVTLHGLTKLGAPDMAGQMVLLSHRYLHVFRHEAERMASGMRVRGFRKRTDIETLRAVANFLGMLFVRSFERTERVFDAMRARGYRGRFPAPVDLKMRPADLVLVAAWLAAGAALVGYDRICG
ncbi:energy-coupling factor transporter transmembrane protein EcfT [Desulfococcus sp.]|uniref:energy-coupling factor transporter transmembrane component T family protein n=1 Tax=Desulfococcus sp. TaxID=2025834 RepID=UPI0035946DEA